VIAEGAFHDNLLRAWAVLLLCPVLLFAPPSQAKTTPNTVQIEQNDAWVDFPQAVDFHLVAAASAPIEDASIEYGVDARICGDVTSVANPDFEPTTALDLTWRWEVAHGQIIPPGGKIWWRWRLTTAGGVETTTPTQTVAFDDDWFLWQSLQDRNLTIYWYRGPRSLAQDMLDAGHAALDQLATSTGLRLEDPVAIYLYEEPLDLRLSIPGAPSWIGGIAFPEYNTVLAVASLEHSDYARRTVRHELGHLVIGRLTFNCLTDLPVWLDEGLAMVAEGEEDPDAAARLDEAIAEDRLLTIRQIESAFSVHANRASLSYAESYSLVRFLIDSYGQENMLALLVAFREGVTPDDALTSAYGFDTQGLEEAWRAAIGASPAASSEENVDASTPVPTLALPTLPSLSPTALTVAPAPESVAQVAEATAPPTQPATTVDVRDGRPGANWPVWAGGALFSLVLIIVFALLRLRNTA